MKATWAQPSLSRDFTLLSFAIIFLLLLISAWVTWGTYTAHSTRVVIELEKEANRIDRTLEREIENAGYLLNAIGHQITALDMDNLRGIGQLLKTFDAHSHVYAVWSWVDMSQRVVVSSNKGVLDEPINVADRDYVQKSQADPWQIQIGRPIQGRVSGRWVIPISMGLTDSTGKYIGSLVSSVDINALTDQISHLIKRDGVSFAIVSKTFVPLTEVSDSPNFIQENFTAERFEELNIARNPKGVISKSSLFSSSGIYAYYQVSIRYPYVILVGYDNTYSDEAIRNQLWPRLVQIIALAGFLLLFLWIVRARVIKPVVDLTEIAHHVAHGEYYTPMSRTGPIEIENLAQAVSKISEFITERKRVEDEIRSKLAELSERVQNQSNTPS